MKTTQEKIYLHTIEFEGTNDTDQFSFDYHIIEPKRLGEKPQVAILRIVDDLEERELNEEEQTLFHSSFNRNGLVDQMLINWAKKARPITGQLYEAFVSEGPVDLSQFKDIQPLRA